MVGDESWAKENVVTGILRLVRENGIFSTFGGLPAMLCKQVSDAVLCIVSTILHVMYTIDRIAVRQLWQSNNSQYPHVNVYAYTTHKAATPLSTIFTI